VYALGVVCHEMLSGTVPFTGESPLAVLMAHLTLPPPRLSQVCPELPPELDEPVLHMLAKEVDGRPRTASEAIAELIRAAERAGIVVPAGMPHLPRPPLTVVAYPGGELFDTEASPRASDPVHSPRRPDPSDPAALLARTDRAAEKPARNWSFVALLIALAGGALYLGSSALRASNPGAAPPPLAAAQPPAATPPPPATPPPTPPSPGPGSTPSAPPPSDPTPSPRTINLTLRGAPSGARVSLNGTSVGEVPGPIHVPASDQPIELRVSAAGHAPQTLTITPEHDQSVDVKLDKLSKPEKKPPHPKAAGGIPSDLENPF
jgi:serine/threonine-protein kinase